MGTQEYKRQSIETSGILQDQNGIYRTIQRSFVTATTSGNTELVASQGSDIKIRVISVTMVCLLAVVVKFQSSTTDISPQFSFGSNGGASIPHNIGGIFQTASGEALNVNLSLDTTVGVNITWIPTT